MARRPAPERWAWGLVLVALLAPGLATGHDLWILAGQYHLEPFETTRVFINNGDLFPASLTLLGENRVTALALHGPTETRPISEFRVEDKSLSFEISPTKAGSHVVALSTRARRVRLKALDFNEYLDDNGLDWILAKREEAGESGTAAVERYTKWAKALIDVGEPEAAEEEPAWSKPVGHTIEIVPDGNPNEVRAGGSFGLRVLYEGEPLAGVTVAGGKAGGAAGEVRTTTDADGHANVTILSSGRWYLRAVHMVERKDDPEVRWESFWCTLTFEVR
jgi:hypothetical protein